MKRKISRILLVGAVAGLLSGGPAAAPAQACAGDVCDAICAVYTARPKLGLGHCPIN